MNEQNEQLDLFADRDKTLQEKFEEFHEANPHVYEYLEERCREVYRPGRVIGIELLISQMRWQSLIRTEAADGFKINQNYASRYVRMLVANNPEWKDMFRFRRLRS